MIDSGEMERPLSLDANKRLSCRLHCSTKETKGKEARNSLQYPSMASVQCQKHNEICQTKSHHTKLGQKISEMTNKAFKGHTNTNASSKTETHCYTQTQTAQNLKDQGVGVAQTEITLLVVQARVTQTNANHPLPPASARGATTTCFGNHTWKNRDHNNKKDRNLFRRIKDGVSRHNSSGSDNSSDSDSDNENCRTRKN